MKKLWILCLWIAPLFSLPNLDLSSWTNPTLQDYQRIQDYLEHGERPELKWLNDISLNGKVVGTQRESRIRKFKVFDEKLQSVPKLQTVAINTHPRDRECCVIAYASCNMPYEKFAKRLARSLREVNYKGHYLYQVGGWPYVDRGSLTAIDTPYGFKPCMFKEAMRRGYRYVVWLDVASNPTRLFPSLFQKLKSCEAFVFIDPLPLTYPSFEYIIRCQKHFRRSLKTSWAEMQNMRHFLGGLVGFDLSKDVNRRIVNLWYKAALEKNAFLSLSPDQLPLSYLVQKHSRRYFVFGPGVLERYRLGLRH